MGHFTLSFPFLFLLINMVILSRQLICSFTLTSLFLAYQTDPIVEKVILNQNDVAKIQIHIAIFSQKIGHLNVDSRISLIPISNKKTKAPK